MAAIWIQRARFSEAVNMREEFFCEPVRVDSNVFSAAGRAAGNLH
jgi:hypothetical protein